MAAEPRFAGFKGSHRKSTTNAEEAFSNAGFVLEILKS
jgi:hypothetical protein